MLVRIGKMPKYPFGDIDVQKKLQQYEMEVYMAQNRGAAMEVRDTRKKIKLITDQLEEWQAKVRRLCKLNPTILAFPLPHHHIRYEVPVIALRKLHGTVENQPHMKPSLEPSRPDTGVFTRDASELGNEAADLEYGVWVREGKAPIRKLSIEKTPGRLEIHERLEEKKVSPQQTPEVVKARPSIVQTPEPVSKPRPSYTQELPDPIPRPVEKRQTEPLRDPKDDNITVIAAAPHTYPPPTVSPPSETSVQSESSETEPETEEEAEEPQPAPKRLEQKREPRRDPVQQPVQIAPFKIDQKEAPQFSLKPERNMPVDMYLFLCDAGKKAPDITLYMGWKAAKSKDLDCSALVFSGERYNFYEAVYYSCLNAKKPDTKGAITHSGDRKAALRPGIDEEIRIKLSKLSAEISSIVLLLSLIPNSLTGTMANVSRCAFQVLDEGTKTELGRYKIPLSMVPDAQSMLMGRICQFGGKWWLHTMCEAVPPREVEDPFSTCLPQLMQWQKKERKFREDKILDQKVYKN